MTLVIETVVFEDGSYEGNAFNAARFRAFSVGDKLWLEKTVPIWQSFSSDKSEFSKLAEKIPLLSDEPDETAYLELLKDFPMLSDKEKSDLRISIQVAIKTSKREMLADMQKIRETPNQDAKAFRVSLAETKEKYQNQLARLSK